VAQLVAGTGGKTDRAAEPTSTFAAVVLLDLERTADVVVAIAREAEEVYLAECRGFRPRSAVLRHTQPGGKREAPRPRVGVAGCTGLKMSSIV